MSQNASNKKDHVSWIVFIPTVVIVLITLATVVFPAILMTSTTDVKFPTQINFFELGTWGAPLLIGNAIIFSIIVLLYKNKFPKKITNALKIIQNFEISPRIALMVLGVMIGTYAILSVGEIESQDIWDDYKRIVKPALESWTPDNARLSDDTLEYFFGYVSMEVFDNYKAIPFISSIIILFLTYLVTVQITKKRFAGIVSLVLVFQSSNFLTYDTTVTYPNFWILFLLLSLYFVFKSWPLSPISFVTSVLAKSLSMGFLPIIIPFIALLDIPRRKKIKLFLAYLAAIVFGVIAFFTLEPISIGTFSFSSFGLLNGFATFASQFRYDYVIVMFLLPLVVCLFLASKKGISNANSVMVLIGGMLLLTALVPAFTTFTNTPYRFLPLVFFFAIGVATLFAKKSSLVDELLSNKQ